MFKLDETGFVLGYEMVGMKAIKRKNATQKF